LIHIPKKKCVRCDAYKNECEFGTNQKNGEPMKTCEKCRVTRQHQSGFRKQPTPAAFKIIKADIYKKFMAISFKPVAQ